MPSIKRDIIVNNMYAKGRALNFNEHRMWPYVSIPIQDVGLEEDDEEEEEEVNEEGTLRSENQETLETSANTLYSIHGKLKYIQH